MATEANKRRLETNSTSPEGCKSKKSKKRHQKQRGNSNSGSSVCCVCNCVIVEDTNESDGEDAIFCEGSWLHRRCAGLSKPVFQHLSDSNKPFLCVYCLLSNQAVQIAKLQETLAQLTSKLSPAGDSSNLPTAQSAPINLPNKNAVKSTEVKSKSSTAYSEKMVLKRVPQRQKRTAYRT